MSQARRHLNECCAIALKSLGRALPKMLDQVDDALFQLAEKADHDNTQKLYFDAMREVRIQRPGIEKNFKEYLREGFVKQDRKENPAAALPDRLDFNSPQLSLVDDDVLEESLAVTNMANRIAGLCKEELFALEMRIGWLLDDTSLEEHENPLSPRAICENFAQACGEIDSATEIRLIVLKLFDKHMAGAMQGVYQELNQYLVRNDILPYIRAEVKKQPHGSPPAAADPLAANRVSAETGAVPVSPQAFTGFGSAAAVASPVVASGTQIAGNIPVTGTGAQPAGSLPLQLSQELLSTLQQIMRVNGGSAQAQPDSGLEEPPGAQLLGRLTALQVAPDCVQAVAGGVTRASASASVLRDLRQTELGEQLNHSDDLMIDVVAMMFDYIFDDANIPAPMKALIGRLQIPLLKVAMLDKSFFSRRFHPARKLLNALAEAAVGWSDERGEHDGLYATMERTVQRVLDEFDDQISVIAEILAEFESYLEEDNRQAEENAWWSAKVIQGRERLASARTQIDAILDERLAGIEYRFLSAFLREHWQNVLLTTYVKDGEGSDPWRQALATLDDLIWSVTPIAEEPDRTRLSSLLPDMLVCLKQGISRISLAPDEAERLLAKLARIHLAQVRGQPLPDEDELEALQSDALPPVPQSSAALDQDCDEGATSQAGSAQAQPLSPDSGQLRAALESANQRIHAQAQNRPECSGMGTTVVAAWFRDGVVITAHAGDSRLYRLRDDHLQQMTLDHSLRQQMVSNGFYTMEEAKQAIASNLVTRALGVDPEVEIEVREYPALSGDIYLLCSDGLSDLVEDEAIESVLKAADMELDSAARSLIDMANDNGGSDNISVTLVRVWQTADTQIEDTDLLEVISRTDVGKRRAHNEDAQGELIEMGLVILADGMGGYNAGEVASRLAVDSVIEILSDAIMPQAPDDALGVDTAGTDTDINFAALNSLFDNAGITGPGAPSGFPELDMDESADCEEIVLETTGSDAIGNADEQIYAEQVAALEIGAWIEFNNEGNTLTRARLTWISESTGNYLFTDRHGHKVVDATPAGLAMEFRRGSAALIEDVPLFERAVNHLMARLRSEAG